MSDELQHHRYSASGAEGWLACPGKLVMEEGIPDRSSPDADQGSAAHYLGAYCLENSLRAEDFISEEIRCWTKDGRAGQSMDTISPVPEGATITSSWKVTREMADFVQGYVDFVRKAAEGKDLIVEQRVHFGPAIGLPGAFGTTDAGAIAQDGSAIHTIDLKYGYGYVSAVENPQEMLYTAGVLEDFEMLYDFDNLRALTQTIYQPRIDNISSWTYAKADLDAFLAKAREAIAIAEEARTFFKTPNIHFETQEEWEAEYLKPSEKGCKWCKRKGDCRAYAKAMVGHFVEANADDFDDLDAPQMLALPKAEFEAELDAAIARVPSLPFETVAKLYGVVGRFEDWLKAIQARMYEGLMNGETHPDWKLVQGKQGNRKWTDDTEVETAMKAMRLKVDEMYDKEIISPTSAEKLLKKRPKLWAKLEPMITRAEGKISIAPMSDKRPAIVIENPVEALPDLSDDLDDLLGATPTAVPEPELADFLGGEVSDDLDFL